MKRTASEAGADKGGGAFPYRTGDAEDRRRALAGGDCFQRRRTSTHKSQPTANLQQKNIKKQFFDSSLCRE